jgi:predicted nucleic acid-binding protein
VLPQQRSVAHVQPSSQALQPDHTQELHQKQQSQLALLTPHDADDCLRSRLGQGEFCLIAEAAKRAQIEVLMRDMSEVAL